MSELNAAIEANRPVINTSDRFLELIMRCEEGFDFAALKALLEGGCFDVNASMGLSSNFEDWKPPLLWAIDFNREFKVFALLLKKGAANGMDAYKYTTFHYAVEHADMSLFDLLFKSWRGLDIGVAEPIIQCAAKMPNHDEIFFGVIGDPNDFWARRVKILHRLLDRPDRHVLVNEKDDLGFAALQHAALGGRSDIIEILLDAGANVDALDNDKGRSALQMAIEFAHVDAVRMLLVRGKASFQIGFPSPHLLLFESREMQ